MVEKADKFDFKVLFDMMPTPRLIVDVEGENPGQVIECNDYACNYFKRIKDNIVGHKMPDILSADNSHHFEQSFRVSIARKRVVNVRAMPSVAEDMRVHKFWINPILNDEGEVVYLDVLGQIELKDETSLQRERDDAVSFLASIFEVSEVGIIVTNDRGTIVRANDSFLRAYGWAREEIIGNYFTDLVTDDERERTRLNHKKFLSVGVRSTGEVKMLRKGGGVANVLFTSAILNLSQNRKYLVTTVMDITLRKQMEQSLRVAKDQADAANQSKSNFLANMSHELRTPLNAIIGFSELMIKETFGPIGKPKYKEYMDDIHMSAQHLLGIINEVLDMSKIEAGQIELVEEIFSIQETIVSVCRMMSSRVFASNIDIIREIEDNISFVRADYRLIRQVLINLIANAIKFSPQGSKITVGAKINDDGDMFISVTDEGVGIREDKIKRALEPFGQVDDSADMRDVSQQGTGLGLPLAKAMVEMHGGNLYLKSEFGIGTCASFTLPASSLIPDVVS